MWIVQERPLPDHAAAPIWKVVRARLGDFYRKTIRRDVPILTFHRIRPGDGTSLETLREILDYVASELRVLTLGELADLLRRRTSATGVGGRRSKVGKSKVGRPWTLDLGPSDLPTSAPGVGRYRARTPRNHIILTFDDATKDQYDLAAPELNQRGLRATFGVIGCTLFEPSVPPLHWYLHLLETTVKPSVQFGFPPYFTQRTLPLDSAGKRALAEPKSPLRKAIQGCEHRVATQIVASLGEALAVPPPKVGELFISLAQMRSLLDQGHEAAGHSLRHQDVHEPDEAAWNRDLYQDFALMNEAFGPRSHPFIYPFGTERRPTIHAKIKEAGFCCAATSEWGTNRQGADPYALCRIGVDNDTKVPLATIY